MCATTILPANDGFKARNSPMYSRRARKVCSA
jgi:hypothetical protein